LDEWVRSQKRLRPPIRINVRPVIGRNTAKQEDLPGGRVPEVEPVVLNKESIARNVVDSPCPVNDMPVNYPVVY